MSIKNQSIFQSLHKTFKFIYNYQIKMRDDILDILSQSPSHPHLKYKVSLVSIIFLLAILYFLILFLLSIFLTIKIILTLNVILLVFSLLLCVSSSFFIILILVKMKVRGFNSYILGFYFNLIWMFITYLIFYIKNIDTYILSPVMAISIYLIVIHTLSSNFTIINEKDWLIILIQNGGWLFIGAILADFFIFKSQMSLFLFNFDHIIPIPILETRFMILNAIWGLSVLYIYHTNKNMIILFDLKTKYVNWKVTLDYYSRLIIIIGSLSFIFQIMSSEFTISDKYLLLHFSTSRFFIILGLSIIIWLTFHEPRQALGTSRLLQYLYENEEISVAIFAFDDVGPVVIYSEGFKFIDQEKRESELQLIALSSLTALGLGHSAKKSHAIIPVLTYENYRAIIITNFMRNKLSIDSRFRNATYVGLFICIPLPLRNLFQYIGEWNKFFDQYCNEKDDVHNDQSDIGGLVFSKLLDLMTFKKIKDF
jgi:hypothetical protein